MVSNKKGSGSSKGQGSRVISGLQSKASLPPKPSCHKRTRNAASSSDMPPSLRSSDSGRTRTQRSWGRRSASWTPEEDAKLVELVTKESATPPSITASKTWSRVAAQLTNRTGKQCRERYLNQLKPGIRRDPWSAEEERILREAHARLGNKWVAIANQLPGRTDNCVKNHWNSMLRKRQRREAALKAAQAEAAASLSNSQPTCSKLDRKSEAENSTRTGCASPSGVSSHCDVRTSGAASPYTTMSSQTPQRDSKLQISTLVAGSTKELLICRLPCAATEVVCGKPALLTANRETKSGCQELIPGHSINERPRQVPQPIQTVQQTVASLPLGLKLAGDANRNLLVESSAQAASNKFLPQNMSPMQCIASSPHVPQIMQNAHSSDPSANNGRLGRQVRRSSRLSSSSLKERAGNPSSGGQSMRSAQRYGVSKPRYRNDVVGTNALAALAAAASSMPPSPLTPESRFSGTARSRSVSPSPRLWPAQVQDTGNSSMAAGSARERRTSDRVSGSARISSGGVTEVFKRSTRPGKRT